MDNLFRSIRVSEENSSVTEGFHFLELIWTPDFVCVQNAPFKATSSIFNPFWLHLLFFMHLLFFWAIRPWNWKKHYKWTLKRLKVGMVSSFHPHSMCKKVERLKAKTGCTSCTKQTISFEVSGFHTETCLLQQSLFWTYLNPRIFLCWKCTIRSHIINFQPFLTSFVIFHAFTGFFSIRPWNSKAFQMNFENVESWHGIIISPA